MDSVLRNKREAYSIVLQSVERSRISFANALTIPPHLATEEGEWDISVEKRTESLRQRIEFGVFLESLVKGQKRKKKKTPSSVESVAGARSPTIRAASPTSMFRAVSPSPRNRPGTATGSPVIAGAGELMDRLLALKRNHKANIVQRCVRKWIARSRARKWREKKKQEKDQQFQNALQESVLVLQACAKTKYQMKFIHMREWKKK